MTGGLTVGVAAGGEAAASVAGAEGEGTADGVGRAATRGAATTCGTTVAGVRTDRRNGKNGHATYAAADAIVTSSAATSRRCGFVAGDSA